MKRFKIFILLIILLLTSEVYAESINQQEAVRKAEQFILANGYSNAPQEALKQTLDLESLEWERDRKEILKMRNNTLRLPAIGARKHAKGREGWSVAFDYVDTSLNRERPICRVVTMDAEGHDMKVEHVDGFRDAFAGFDEGKRDNN